MKKWLTLFIFCVCGNSFAFAQKNTAANPGKPKLVVGIVVDQMRYDFLWRFWDLYGDRGFKRLVNDGFLCQDARYNYFLTTTAPGHSTIYTGTTAAIHGIVDNNWYDRESNKIIYCTTDSMVKPIGIESTAASSSPYRLKTSTITDELKLASKESKVIGIAIKDRSAIMPAGHFPNGSFWFDGVSGNWITSSWYMDNLPDWAKQINQSGEKDKLLADDWKLMLPAASYAPFIIDSNKYENSLPGESTPVFPHKLPKGNYTLLPYTPFGNTFTKDMAIAAVRGEELGKRNATDFLCISFSSTDIIGHTFGPNSLETADCYVRLDKDIESLLDFLDANVGKDNLLVFLTADHGVALVPQLGKDEGLNAGVFPPDSMSKKMNDYIASFYGKGTWIAAAISQQIYLDRKFIASTKISEEEIAGKVARFLEMQEGISCVVAPEYHINTCPPYTSTTILNGYDHNRSGDVLYSLAPGWVDWASKKGSSHGTIYSYDTHVPLIWYGWKISPGVSNEPVTIPDIAPTISNWLNIAYPSGCTGKPISAIKLK
jgi:predicted AlkP superfamily pyrophosphatase or phosphodiesterase